MLALLGLCVLFAPAAAVAKRPATAAEATAVAAAYGVDPVCSTVVMSTVNPLFARWTYASPYPASCPARGDGFGIARLQADGSWKDVYQASEVARCAEARLPAGAGVDLGACTTRPPRVYALGASQPFYKPRRLPQGAHGIFVAITWSTWTSRTAKGRGRLDYVDAYDRFIAPVRLVLSKPRNCDGIRYFLRMSVRLVRARDRARLGAIAGVHNFVCPR